MNGTAQTGDVLATLSSRETVGQYRIARTLIESMRRRSSIERRRARVDVRTLLSRLLQKLAWARLVIAVKRLPGGRCFAVAVCARGQAGDMRDLLPGYDRSVAMPESDGPLSKLSAGR